MKEVLTQFSQALRRNMTKEEKHLWYDFLKKLPITVKRQEVIDNYIVDFYIPQVKIIIELDGSQHYTEEGEAKDSVRDNTLGKFGIKILRYTNREVNRNFDGVCRDIQSHIDIALKGEAFTH